MVNCDVICGVDKKWCGVQQVKWLNLRSELIISKKYDVFSSVALRALEISSSTCHYSFHTSRLLLLLGNGLLDPTSLDFFSDYIGKVKHILFLVNNFIETYYKFDRLIMNIFNMN